MAINSTFYPGSVNAQEWGEGQDHLGAEYFVPTLSDWRVTAVTGATRTVRIAQGVIGGRGIRDKNTANIDVQITASLPASGSKYYTIVARRTWQTDDETTVVALAGTSARAIAASRETSPGTVDDQPLALVRIDAGSTVAVVTDDLRAIGYNKGHYIASSTLVTTYLNKPGYRLTIGADQWFCDLTGAWSKGGNLPRYGYDSDHTPDFTGDTSVTRYLHGANIPVRTYARMVQFQGAANVSVPASGDWALSVKLADQGSPVASDEGLTLVSIPLVSGPSGATRHGPTPVAQVPVAPGEAKVIRMWLIRNSGGAVTVRDSAGISAQITWTEVRSGNDW